jgi:ketosteroid isomerase-like protein
VSNIATVHDIYAAFGRGDVPAILARLAPDVEWEYGPATPDVPWLQPRRGPGEVGHFFASLAAIEFRRFEPTAFFESGPTVVVLIQLEAVVRATGRAVVEADEVHIWHFDAAGQVARFRHRVDTLQHHRAFTRA